MRGIKPNHMKQPDEFREFFCGTPHWSLKLLPQLEEVRKGWVENVFSNPGNEYDAVWHNKLAFSDVGNGDYLAFDILRSFIKSRRWRRTRLQIGK